MSAPLNPLTRWRPEPTSWTHYLVIGDGCGVTPSGRSVAEEVQRELQGLRKLNRLAFALQLTAFAHIRAWRFDHEDWGPSPEEATLHFFNPMLEEDSQRFVIKLRDVVTDEEWAELTRPTSTCPNPIVGYEVHS